MDKLLKFIACGSVDDGKSTLIGHMLYDAKLLFTDQEKSLELDSKVGSRDGGIDYSLLLDGLMAEREQGITIDVAYRYFTTERRSFIVVDTPGHEEYTRNMVVGASFADLAVILVDATQGILVQTRRHTRICSLMGIRHLVFAINKMDLADYGQERFEAIVEDIKSLMAEFEGCSYQAIPVSATEGDNVTNPSKNMAWYQGKPLLAYLEEIDVEREADGEEFLMPIQRVCRPNYAFRGFQGQIESGSIQVGERIKAYPSGEKAIVSGILQEDKEVKSADKGRAVTIQLDKEIDVSRGCVLACRYKPFVGTRFSAKLVWMDDGTLTEGKNYWLKIGTKKVPAAVTRIGHKIDVNTGKEIEADVVKKNEIAVCDISVSDKVVFDSFESQNVLGSLILVDRITHMTSACGVILSGLKGQQDLTWQKMDVTRMQRANQKNQKAKTIWFTGLSGAGKSMLANELEKRLFAMGRHTMTLDGDNVRLGLNQNLSFGKEDRIENIRRIAEVSKLMNDAGLIVICSFVSPYERDRENARVIIGDESFVEVYVSTPIEECERRDVKGLYKKAREGKIPNFTGITSPYEVPQNPDVVIDTSVLSVEESGDNLLQLVEKFIR